MSHDAIRRPAVTVWAKHGDRLHELYSQRPLAAHIASGPAIAGLAAWIDACRPRHVVELGAGIGTLTQCLLEVGARFETAPRIDTFEDYAPCYEALQENMTRVEVSRDNLVMHHDYAELADVRDFDFLVVDGGTVEHAGVAARLRPRGVVFVEGDRQSQIGAIRESAGQRRWVGQAFPSHQLKQGTAEGASRPSFDGGYSVLAFEPSLRERALFFCYRVRTAWLYRVVRPRVLRRGRG